MNILLKALTVCAALFFTIGNVSAAVTYTIGLKLDNLSDYQAFSVDDVRCADAGSTTTYDVDVGNGCTAAGFLLAPDDIKPSEAETFEQGVDSLLLTVDKIKDNGEILGGTLKFTLVTPQTYIPLSGDMKAGNESGLGGFVFDPLGNGMYTASFDVCPTGSVNDCSAVSNIEITFGEVPLPAAAWLFGSCLISLAGIARKKKAA